MVMVMYPQLVRSKHLQRYLASKVEVAEHSASAGECGGDIETFCKSVKAGRRRLADCLQKQVNEEVTGNVQGKFKHETLLQGKRQPDM